jgi:hypothetical protein
MDTLLANCVTVLAVVLAQSPTQRRANPHSLQIFHEVCLLMHRRLPSHELLGPWSPVPTS